jgi:hypothetical protein
MLNIVVLSECGGNLYPIKNSKVVADIFGNFLWAVCGHCSVAVAARIERRIWR